MGALLFDCCSVTADGQTDGRALLRRVSLEKRQNSILQLLSLGNGDLRAARSLNERHLKRLLSAYISYYHDDRTHLGLGKRTPGGRSPSLPHGCVIAGARLGGLHHSYDRAA